MGKLWAFLRPHHGRELNVTLSVDVNCKCGFPQATERVPLDQTILSRFKADSCVQQPSTISCREPAAWSYQGQGSIFGCSICKPCVLPSLFPSPPVRPLHLPSGWREASNLILPQILVPDHLPEMEAQSAVHSHGNSTIKRHHSALCAAVTCRDASEWRGNFIYLLLRLYMTFSFSLQAFEWRVVLCVWNVTGWVTLAAEVT